MCALGVVPKHIDNTLWLCKSDSSSDGLSALRVDYFGKSDLLKAKQLSISTTNNNTNKGCESVLSLLVFLGKPSS